MHLENAMAASIPEMTVVVFSRMATKDVDLVISDLITCGFSLKIQCQISVSWTVCQKWPRMES
jgi:hypothetical protein